MSDEPIREEWLYLGQRSPDLKKLYHCWRSADGKTRMWDKAPKPTPIPGAVYEVHFTGDGEHCSLFMSGSKAPRFLRQHPNEEERQAIHVDHCATVNAHRAIREARESPIDGMTITQLRGRLRRLPSPQRRALLAVILEKLL
jgi:hypothetical protein